MAIECSRNTTIWIPLRWRMVAVDEADSGWERSPLADVLMLDRFADRTSIAAFF